MCECDNIFDQHASVLPDRVFSVNIGKKSESESNLVKNATVGREQRPPHTPCSRVLFICFTHFTVLSCFLFWPHEWRGNYRGRRRKTTAPPHTEHESAAVFHISSTFPLRNHKKYDALDTLPRHSCGVDFSFQEVRGELRHPGQFLVGGKNILTNFLRCVKCPFVILNCNGENQRGNDRIFLTDSAVFESLHQECVTHALTTKLRLTLTCGHIKTRMWAALLSLHQKHTDETTARDFFSLHWLLLVACASSHPGQGGQSQRRWLSSAVQITQDQR